MFIQRRNQILLSFLICILLLAGRPSHSESDELRQGEPLEDGKELQSADGKFRLGFFSPRGTTKRYLGIWYNKIRDRNDYMYHYFRTEENVEPVWVANRNTPVGDKSGKLTINSTDGNLKILRCKGDPIVISGIQAASGKTRATLKNSGNLVLYDINSQEPLWQSFDYPTDTLLPGMKLGINSKTGREWFLQSWNSLDSPANGSGSYNFGLDPNDNKSLAIWRRQNPVDWTSGLWLSKTKGFRSATESAGYYYNFSYTTLNNEREIYFIYSVNEDVTPFPALTIDEDGNLWDDAYHYVTCSVFGGCDDYYCNSSEDTFHLIKHGYMYAEGSKYKQGENVSYCECRDECQRKRCFAFASTTNYKRCNHTSCEIWDKPPTMLGESCLHCDRKIYVAVRKELPWLTIKLLGALAMSLLCTVCYGLRRKYKAKEEKWWQSLALALLMIPLLFYLSHLMWTKLKAKVQSILNRRRLLRELDGNVSMSLPIFFGKRKAQQKNQSAKHELKIFDFQIIAAATDNFSTANKLGQGGFGPVYKGKLLDGQEVAIKKLSKSSGQGIVEFKNEAKLIAKLQHTNLVRLLGCSLHGGERILVYEYMPNKSLDLFIFGSRRKMLNLKKRLNIIEGIAQGLIYLHKYSRLTVIHRDLKLSNILLDNQMNPKISDFGMARAFEVNELEANTNRIVGTHGYMPPEYVMNGIVSLKTDIYSFGVMVLEIVSSKRNTSSYDRENLLNLAGYAWRLWNQGRVLELIDQMDGSCSPKEVLRFLHVGLLCVQDLAGNRPTMLEVVSMLTNDTIVLPAPKQPAFFINITSDQELQVTENKLENCSANNVTISVMEARE